LYLLPKELVETNHFGNLFIEESVETNYSTNLFTKKLVEKTNYSDLFTNELVWIYKFSNLFTEELVEIGISCSLSNQELVEESTNDLLRKHLVEKIPISPILSQINDVLVNLVTCVNFLEKNFPKGRIVFQALPPFTLWL